MLESKAVVKMIYYNGSEKEMKVNDQEFPYPEGQLIISRTDTKGIITHANEAFVILSGYTKEELMGQPHSMIRHPDMPRAAFKDLWDTLWSGKKWQGYVKNLRKDGGYYWVFATVVPNYRNGEIVGFTSVRRQPPRSKIEELIPVYAEMRAKEEF